jgi:activator of 2-hydroxyglutaryl-CoA dehydratase
MFPVSVVSTKAVLNGGTALNKAVAPRLSGKNVAPVIINTNQRVGGVTKA